MNTPIRDKHDEVVGREKYARWKQVSGAKPQWLQNAITNNGARLEGWEISFFEAYLKDAGDRQPATPPLPLPVDEPVDGGEVGVPVQGELPVAPTDGQPPIPPLPVVDASDCVLPDE
jgi:hypothetical protein